MLLIQFYPFGALELIAVGKIPNILSTIYVITGRKFLKDNKNIQLY
jgi:hypothetical protein